MSYVIDALPDTWLELLLLRMMMLMMMMDGNIDGDDDEDEDQDWGPDGDNQLIKTCDLIVGSKKYFGGGGFLPRIINLFV